MIRRISLRTRVTLFVTATFAVALILGAYAALDRVESSLVADTRATAEQLLGDYLENITSGSAAVGIDEQTGAQFFYRDNDGEVLSEQEYFALLAAEVANDLRDAEIDRGLEVFEVVPTDPDRVGSIGGLEPPPLLGGEVSVEWFEGVTILETGILLDVSGEPVTFSVGPVAQGRPEIVEMGDDVVALVQQLEFSDGRSFSVGVSNSLEPIRDSLDAFARVVWLAVPILLLLVAAMTWLAATRALAPVQGISDRARAISAERLAERVPVPDTNDEIHELAQTVNGMLERIEASQSRQRQLVSDASHELRSPVAASRVQLEVAAAANDLDTWKSTAATVLAEQERLSQLIDDLLVLSRLDEGLATPDETVNLADVIDDELGRPHRFPVSLVTEREGRALVDGDSRLLARLFRNLVDNAARHADGTVDVHLLQTAGEVIVHVDDDGPGVPDSAHATIFDRFTRVDEARQRDDRGGGLGLAIVREVAEAHGGSVACERADLGGARFTVTLPRSKAAA